MKTQKFLNVVRLMTFTAIFGIFSFTAFAADTHDEDHTPARGGAENHAGETSEQVEMEPWMSDPLAFQTPEQREMNQLKSWMIDEEFFETREQRNLNAIEDWMVDKEFWNI